MIRMNKSMKLFNTKPIPIMRFRKSFRNGNIPSKKEFALLTTKSPDFSTVTGEEFNLNGALNR